MTQAPKQHPTSQSPLTADLVRRASDGEMSAQEELLRQLQDTIFRFCLSQLGQEDQAREATQETALRLLQSLAKFRGDAQLKTWVLGIALNVCRKSRRQAQRFNTQQIEPEMTPLAMPSQTQLDVDHTQQRLRGLLVQLAPRQREVLVLRYFEQLSVDQTAQAMSISPGTVKATASQAIAKLRRLIGEDD